MKKLVALLMVFTMLFAFTALAQEKVVVAGVCSRMTSS